MAGACNTYEKYEKFILRFGWKTWTEGNRFGWKTWTEGDRFGDPGVDGRMLKKILNKWDGRMGEYGQHSCDSG